jgi:hypothetical protein
MKFAPRISPRLVEAIVRLDDTRVPIAEVNRRVGSEAERLGLRRPSYQRVRELVHQTRRLRRVPPTTGRPKVFMAIVLALYAAAAVWIGYGLWWLARHST